MHKNAPPDPVAELRVEERAGHFQYLAGLLTDEQYLARLEKMKERHTLLGATLDREMEMLRTRMNGPVEVE